MKQGHPSSEFDYPAWEKQCPICKGRREVVRQTGPASILVSCPKSCGKFTLDSELDKLFRAFPPRSPQDILCSYLCCHTRPLSDKGDRASLTVANWEELAITYRDTPSSDKCDRLLTLLATRAGAASKFVEFDMFRDGIHAWEPNPGGFMTLLNRIAREGLVEFEAVDDPEYQSVKVAVTMTGWDAFVRLRRVSKPDPQVSVMPKITCGPSERHIGVEALKVLAPALKSARKKYEHSLEEAAVELDVTPKTVDRWEKAERRPYRRHLRLILRYIEAAPVG